MPRSNASFLGQLLGTSQKITASALDSSVSASLGGSVTTYATAAALPLSGNTSGDQAFVSETGRLYIFTGTGWYNIALINTNPTITSGANASYSLSIDGTPTVLTLVANDPEGIPITWSYSVTTGSLTNGGGTSAVVTQADNVFTITPSTNQTYEGVFGITFTASDGVNLATSASTFSLAWSTSTVDYLVVAGGGGGGTGSDYPGGGGAGGFLTGTGFGITPGVALGITVGAGGAPGVSGANSSFSTIIATGGGNGGGQGPGSYSAGNGGSGGGGGLYTGIPPGSGIVGQGNDGGAQGNYPNPGDTTAGGGGGAGAPGVAGGPNGGQGGAGLYSSISGTSIAYAGGGGGTYWQQSAGTYALGGVGGGGNGGRQVAGATVVFASDGAPNTGGGGGGCSSNTGVNQSAYGGSGVVILRYADTFPPATSTTGSPTITVAGGYRVYKFTQSGSITF